MISPSRSVFVFVAVLAASGPASAVDRVAWIDELGLSAGLPLVTLPPAAGAIIGLDEQRKQDSYTQTITLQGDPGTVGENQIVVTVTRDGLAPRTDLNTIDDELAARFPDIGMTVGPAGTRNVFGIFGSAVGSRGAMNCFYGWQGVNLADRWITGEAAGFFGERHALSIRTRLCRTTASAEELTALFSAAQSRGGVAAPLASAGGGYDPLAAAASLGVGANVTEAAGSTIAYPAYPAVIQPVGHRRADAQDSPRPARRHRVRARTMPALAQETVPSPPQPMAGMPAVPLPQ